VENDQSFKQDIIQVQCTVVTRLEYQSKSTSQQINQSINQSIIKI